MQQQCRGSIEGKNKKDGCQQTVDGILACAVCLSLLDYQGAKICLISTF